MNSYIRFAFTFSKIYERKNIQKDFNMKTRLGRYKRRIVFSFA